MLTILFELLLLTFIVAGVRRRGVPIPRVLENVGIPSAKCYLGIGIAAAFWIVSGILLVILGRLLRINALGRNIKFILPHGTTEITLWIALSVTAGICEETIFRGYLQPQFMAWTESVPADIVLSTAALGAAHAYQGFRMVVLIGLYGIMFGILAHWRGSVRPGMIAHAWQDSLMEFLPAYSSIKPACAPCS